jgi:nucleotide-binding universal stress UspA family protein
MDALPGRLEAADALAKEFFETVRIRYPNTKLENGVGFTATSLVNKVQEMANSQTGRAHTLLVLPKSHEYSWWNEVVGTVETAVAAEAPCPVLIVPEDIDYQGISRIMYLADMVAVANFDYPGFRFLEAFANNFTADLVIGFMGQPVKIDGKEVSLGEAMERFKTGLPFQVTQEYRFFPEYSPEEILQTAEITKTDIIAFPYRDSSLFERFFQDEITRALILKANTPVLVF